MIGDYKILGNNCTTTVCGALNSTGSNALLTEVNHKNGTMQRQTFATPDFLYEYLNSATSTFSTNHNRAIKRNSD